MSHVVFCVKLQKEAEGLDRPPYPGKLGERLYSEVSKEAWRAWLKHQTLLINENHLNMTDLKSRQFLAAEMEKYFFGEGSAAPTGFVAPK
ncbi:MAG TPA: oxidative damage protection protein [Gammaproteobacteria bacterium]|nr:oxidative damage protection protein [Gammaproteobacteria bacterium]